MKKKNQLRHTQNSYHPEDAEIDTPLLTIMVRGTQENGGRSLVSRIYVLWNVHLLYTPHTGFLGKVVRVSTLHPGRCT